MELSQFTSVIDQLSPGLAWLTLYFQGEPYLHSDFFNFISYARAKGIFVSSSTNGHFLTAENALATVKSGLNNLIISVDGTDQKAYSAYRIGGNLKRVIEGVKNLSEAKLACGSKTPLISIQFLALKSNQHQIREIKKKGLEWGGDKVIIKTAQFNDFKHGNPLMPDDKKNSRYKQESINKPGYGESRHSLKSPGERNEKESGQQVSYTLKNSLPRHCFRMWSSCVITWDGNVVPCCFDKNAETSFGNLRDSSFKEIWRSKAYKDFRRMILEKREQISICTNCTEGTGFSRWF